MRKRAKLIKQSSGYMMKREDEGAGRMQSPHFASRIGLEVLRISKMGVICESRQRQLRAVPIKPLSHSDAVKADRIVDQQTLHVL